MVVNEFSGRSEMAPAATKMFFVYKGVQCVFDCLCWRSGGLCYMYHNSPNGVDVLTVRKKDQKFIYPIILCKKQGGCAMVDH